MASKPDRYIPALNKRILTPLYDPVMRLLMREQRFRTLLLDQAGLVPGMRVLDLGCGTGTLAILIQQRFPGLELHALDGDPQVLAPAQAKARRVGVEVHWQEGLAGELHMADFGPPHTFSMQLVGQLTARLEEARDNLRGDLAGMLAGAGFSPVRERGALGTVFGPLSLYQAARSAVIQQATAPPQ